LARRARHGTGARGKMEFDPAALVEIELSMNHCSIAPDA
jgi:hypothetical protein